MKVSKQQIINNTMPMKYQKEYFRIFKGLILVIHLILAVSAGAAS
jgi:flagellar biogenesis protein FliO